jgi:DNA polymerase I-like protein with 3'-5' exonuclease and polymerase domains
LKLVDYLTLQKRKAHVQSWIAAADEDNMVHGSVRTLGTVTGRMTHNNPNMAQVPSVRAVYGDRCRSLWVPKDRVNNVLLGTDAEGLELRCLAHYMNDPEFTQEVLDGDIHTFNQNKAGLATRDQAKTFIYALIYGAGPAKIGQIVGGGSREGKTMIDTFMTSLPKLQTLKSKVERAVQRGFITGLDGRRIPVQFPHTGLNYLLQGAGAIICKTWLVQIDRVIKQKRIRAVPVANIHDEIQFEVNRKDTDELTNAVHASIKKTKTILGFNCDLNCSVVIGESWAETH